MKKPTNFAQHLSSFLSEYLVAQRNVSKNTILSYRDTFKLLLKYCSEVKNIRIENLNLEKLTDNLIIDFLNWLENHRKCSISTRNQRLAAIHSFFRYAQCEEPDGIFHYQKVISISIKKNRKTVIEHLITDAIKIILQQPDSNTLKGRRNLTMLSLLYDTGARVQELVDLRPMDIIDDATPIITLTGKGNKIRRIPLMKNTAKLLQCYLAENNLNSGWKKQHPLFTNSQNTKLTPRGVAYILEKYVNMAREVSTAIPKRVSPHMFRHSKAMHLLQAGVNLIYIRDFLGHVDLKTTEIYARIDTEMKRKAIENAYPEIITDKLPDWTSNTGLLTWLSEIK
ncbi:MAG: site-specific integrase [Bacteroidales bacterium]|jgi:integrase/recombinase XerD|nr:site-specific integrase [Bacteroidales bacterium]